MPAQQSDLSRWFDEGVAQGATHMIVKCDSFDFRGGAHDQCDYPIYVKENEDVRERERESKDRTMEVYNLRMDKGQQINTYRRVFNY